MKGKRIGMLMGGQNSEHEVSLRTGAALARALRARGHQVVELLVDGELPAALRREGVEVAFVALHGRWGEDGCVQGLLECMRIPYTGSGVLASALSMDKVVSKRLFQAAGLRVAEDQVVPRAGLESFRPEDLRLPYPVVVKPACEGSSVGVSIVREAAGLRAALEATRGMAGDALIERFIPGREIQVAVLDDQPLGAIEIVPAEEFYNYKAKYESGSGTRYLFPAPLADAEREEALAAGLGAHRALGCLGVSRVDTVLGADGACTVLEVNALPGMTETSLVPKIAAGLGISFEDLAERLLAGAGLKA
jgi:D-alanine-D-alanine ligase